MLNIKILVGVINILVGVVKVVFLFLWFYRIVGSCLIRERMNGCVCLLLSIEFKSRKEIYCCISFCGFVLRNRWFGGIGSILLNI